MERETFFPFLFLRFLLLETSQRIARIRLAPGQLSQRWYWSIVARLFARRSFPQMERGTGNWKIHSRFLESGGNVIGQGNGTNFHPRIDISTKESRPRINRRKYFFSIFFSSFFFYLREKTSDKLKQFFPIFPRFRKQGNRPNNLTE